MSNESILEKVSQDLEGFIKEYRRDHKELIAILAHHNTRITLLENHNGRYERFIANYNKKEPNRIIAIASAKRVGDVLWKVIVSVLMAIIAAKILPGGI